MTAASATESLDLQVIEAPSGFASVGWRELWRYRELLFFLAWRDVKVRYKQTFFGAAWAVLQPLMMMVVFALLFGRLAGLAERTGEIPYSLYVFAGLLPWTFFANSLAACGASLVAGANLVTKVYFPRLVIPLAAVGAGLVDLGVSMVLLLAMILAHGRPLSWQIALAPLFLLGTLLAAAGVGAMLSALTVSYRDFRYVVPFLVQLWFFVTPVIYPMSLVPRRWLAVFSLNPMAGLIEGFRAALLGSPLDWSSAGISLAASLLLALAGASYFSSVERRLADII